ncbi:unnamed protein product [Rhizophagus irregularis]|nr:unnamed protein product [Rhizophagus irregularis]
MYQDFELRFTYVENNPNNVWQKIDVLQKYQPEEWHIINKMQALWNYYLRKFTLASIQWNEFFIKWYNEIKTVIELITSLKKIYLPDYIFNEREMRAWRAILNHAGCVNITPYTKEISPIAQGSIFEARKYARANGPSCIILKKPIRKVKRITPEQQRQFDSFFQDKAHVIMSSYKTDAKTGKSVVYLKNTKNILWEKFKNSFPNGIKHTTFYTQLMGQRYVYQEDLGGLCSTCSTYGYETFEDIMNLIKEKSMI